AEGEAACVEQPDASVGPVTVDATAGTGTAPTPGVPGGTGAGDGGTAAEGLFRVIPPAPKGLIMPPNNPPRKVRGREVDVWVFVTDQGRVVDDSTRVLPARATEASTPSCGSAQHSGCSSRRSAAAGRSPSGSATRSFSDRRGGCQPHRISPIFRQRKRSGRLRESRGTILSKGRRVRPRPSERHDTQAIRQPYPRSEAQFRCTGDDRDQLPARLGAGGFSGRVACGARADRRAPTDRDRRRRRPERGRGGAAGAARE